MNSYKFFLFYYSLVVITILFLVAPFFLPKPQNIINAVLLTPVAFFLWTHALNPDFFSTPKWSPKIGALVLVFSLLGIFTYFLSVSFAKYLSFDVTTPNSGTALEDIEQTLNESGTWDGEFKSYLENELTTIKTKIDSLGSRDVNVLGVIPMETPALPAGAIGQITAKDANLTDIAIYEVGSGDSKVVGSAKYGITYPYSEKNETWYKITEGWVEARWFMEVNP